MARLSIRLPEVVDSKLGRAAKAGNRPKAAVAREAIVEYLARRERERFLGAIARAARAQGNNGAGFAEEALPIDNEALELAEGRRARERPTRDRRSRSRC